MHIITNMNDDTGQSESSMIDLNQLASDGSDSDNSKEELLQDIEHTTRESFIIESNTQSDSDDSNIVNNVTEADSKDHKDLTSPYDETMFVNHDVKISPNMKDRNITTLDSFSNKASPPSKFENTKRTKAHILPSSVIQDILYKEFK